MAETDWRKILNLSQKELLEADKEALCESLSWMEADDIDLNFSDLKTLFRLAQDILKYKSEQVRNLEGKLETIQTKRVKKKSRKENSDKVTRRSSPNDSTFETVAHQEEVIKANKDILEQLYADIAELEGRKDKYNEDKNDLDKDSESSPDALSEMDAKAHLENDIVQKNKHIRKLLGYTKILEEENSKFKEKMLILKDKLKEATMIIENLTEQMLTLNNECNRLKDNLGSLEQIKCNLLEEVSILKEEFISKQIDKTNEKEELKTKVQHLKSIVRTQRTEIDNLNAEYKKLKENIMTSLKPASVFPLEKKIEVESSRIKELGDKLVDASNEILRSASLIEILKAENKKLKAILKETHDTSDSCVKNQSDDGKERNIIIKLKKKVNLLTIALNKTEEILATREKEILELSAELSVLQSDAGVSDLIVSLKNKKRDIKIKDNEVKSLVKNINKLNDVVNRLQLENETMRKKLNLNLEDHIPTEGILLEFHHTKQQNLTLTKELQFLENRFVTIEMDNREKTSLISKQTKVLKKLGFSNLQNEETQTADNDFKATDKHQEDMLIKRDKSDNKPDPLKEGLSVQMLVEENEGLRKGLEEILNFLKDSSASGDLSFECPSLEAVLNALEARHAVGWFAPHMVTTMQLKEALGGKDALLSVLRQARKEIFDLMTQLSAESQKCVVLQNKLVETENKIEELKKSNLSNNDTHFGEFSSWVLNNEGNEIDLLNKSELEKLSMQRNYAYEWEIKNALLYFRNKYEILYNKMTEIAMNTAEEKNNWKIMEENYKAQIENLKTLKNLEEDEDKSDISPGLITGPESSVLQRRSVYLEEQYRYTRTLYENLKNELLEEKKAQLTKTAKYESQIQSLIINVINLSDKLRTCINEEIFWKQNSILNETLSKYHQIIDSNIRNTIDSNNLLEHLNKSKNDAINVILNQCINNTASNNKDIIERAENIIAETQLQVLSKELESKNSEIHKLIKRNTELQEMQVKVIDDTVASETKDEINMMNQNITQLHKDNIALKEKYKNIQNQLDIVTSQIKDDEYRRLNYETEISMLKHQILDLQSVGDNKAIIARLSNEILMTHLQATDSQRRLDNLKQALDAEKEVRMEFENAWKSQQRILEMLKTKCDDKFRYMHEVVQTLLLQYQGSIPLSSAENYLKSLQELSNKTIAINEKVIEVENLRYSLMTKHSVYNQVLELTKTNCSEGLENCPHKLQLIVSEETQSRELEHHSFKLHSLEEAYKKLLDHCAYLEKTIVMFNQGLSPRIVNENTVKYSNNNHSIKIEDINSDDDSTSKESGTFTIPKPRTSQLQKQIQLNTTRNTKTIATSTDFCEQVRLTEAPKRIEVAIQTNVVYTPRNSKLIQTEEDNSYKQLNQYVENLTISIKEKDNQLAVNLSLLEERNKSIQTLTEEYNVLSAKNLNLTETNAKLTKLNDVLKGNIELLKKELNYSKQSHIEQFNKIKNETNEEIQSLLLSIKHIEDEKNNIIVEYKRLLENEREECCNTVKNLQTKLTEIQKELDGKASIINTSNTEIIKQSISRYTLKNAELEDKCFKLQNSVDDYKADVLNCQSELQRWKDLAAERLEKMEQMSIQLKERYNNEVESYKAENHHWLLQLNETQREHMELRNKLTEQKTFHVKQLSEKDNQIDHLRSVVHNLKTQIMNMQTMLSVNDPSFDLSAIVEVEEASDVSQQGSDKLELKFDSTVDFHEMQDDFTRMATSTAIWQEPVIDRLRREKQLLSKQNGILRRQIKAVAARERRARLDAQNLKNQVFRISTSGGKVPSAESAVLHNKIASLQAQLTSARRDAHSTVALWDKWKRSQQAAERWQARYEEKCQEVNKLDASLHLAKSAVARLEKEKRLLLLRLADAKNEKQLVLEKQDGEITEKSSVSRSDVSEMQTVPVSTRALLERIEAQQRHIAALEVAEKGNEPLVLEYERSLAEITSLKGQVLKLESTLLETQIRSPLKDTQENQPELKYWKSYCDMLKEENAQLTMRVTSLECAPTTAQQHRVNDLEQTVLTLRGLVSKLQAEQKSSATSTQKRADSRPSSGHGVPEKTRSQLESCKTEISNLKRSIQEKDVLLEKSKDMLRIAAEREDKLLSENAFLRQQLEELMDHKRDSLSA